MTAAFGWASMALNIGSSVASGIANRKAVKKQNEFNLLKWNEAFTELRLQLGTAYNRTSVQLSEANRQKIANKLAARRAAHKTIGERETGAAQIGQAGRRAGLNIYRPVRQAEAEALTTEEINAQTTMDNIVQRFNDTAFQAIDALNKAAPVAQQVPSSLGIVSNAFGAALGTYSNMSETQQADFKNSFKGLSNAFSKGGTNVPQINYGGR